jgi:hypothetical protein
MAVFMRAYGTCVFHLHPGQLIQGCRHGPGLQTDTIQKIRSPDLDIVQMIQDVELFMFSTKTLTICFCPLPPSQLRPPKYGPWSDSG